jgi:hypothetical protein
MKPFLFQWLLLIYTYKEREIGGKIMEWFIMLYILTKGGDDYDPTIQEIFLCHLIL